MTKATADDYRIDNIQRATVGGVGAAKVFTAYKRCGDAFVFCGTFTAYARVADDNLWKVAEATMRTAADRAEYEESR